MDDFVEVSSKVYEFPSTIQSDKHWKLKDASCGTESLPASTDQFVQANESRNIGIQTEKFCPPQQSCNDQLLAKWLRKIYPIIEAELLEGVTQIYSGLEYSAVNISLVPYQQLSPGGDSKDTHSTGKAAWLSTRLDNVPDLVVSSSPPHQGWCEHVNQTISLYIPKRIPHEQFVVFTEVRTVPVKACIEFLAVNAFNKNIFAGVTVACDFYIWQHESTNNLEDIKEIAYMTIPYASIVGVDWLQINEVLTAHSDGSVCLWKISKQIVLDQRFRINSKAAVTTILALHPSNFLVGTEEGRLLYCSTVQRTTYTKPSDGTEPAYVELEKHTFAITYLSKGNFNGADVIISYDLSGELFLHDMRNSEDGPLLLIRMPLPFKNSIVCSKDVEYVISPGKDKSIELFRLRNGQRSYVKGSLTEKEGPIRLSDNGCWLITGVQSGTFQIFAVKET